MAYPTSYDTEADFFSDIGEVKVFEVLLSFLSTTTEIDVVDLQGFPVNTPVNFYGVFDDASPGEQPEIVKITHISNGLSQNKITIERAQDGTTAVFHGGGVKIIVEPNYALFNILREKLIDLEEYAASTGVNPSGFSAQGGEFMMYGGELYVGLPDGNMKRISYSDHADLSGLGDDDHPNYLTAARAEAIHAAIENGGVPYDHITAVAHDHDSTATAIRKFFSGLDASKGTPTAIGQIYYATDTKYMYFSANGTTWERYVTMVSGATLFFEGSCPDGWSRVTTLDNRFIRGADTGQAAGGTGGVATHTHSLPVVIAHTHPIPELVASTDSTGSHTHSITAGTGGNGFQDDRAKTGTIGSSSSGSHSHTFTLPDTTTASSGVASPVTDSYSNEPEYRTLVVCKKD